MPVLTQTPTMGDVLKYELNPNFTRETVTLLAGTNIPARNPATRFRNACNFMEEHIEINQVAQGEAAGHAINRLGSNWQTKNVCLYSRRFAVVCSKHAKRHVKGEGNESGFAKVNTEIARSTSEIKYPSTLC